MNRNMYRTIFSKRLGMLVPVAEVAKAQGKGTGKGNGSEAAPRGMKGVLIGHLKAGSLLTLAVSLVFSGGVTFADPLPTGGTITQGSGAINQSGNTLTVTQSSQQLSANWQSFNIGANHSVIFNQPNSSSIALNRIIGNEASSIYGNLSANGQVFLINPNGVLFAPGSQVNVGGLAASTLDISEADFAAGRYRFTGGAGDGSVVNNGQINAGSVVLMGPQVINNGTINTPHGNTTLAAGDRVTVSLMDGLLTAEVDAALAGAEIQNHGQILADGGKVALVAGRADSVLESLINTDGVIRANSLRNQNGKIYLDGGAGGTVRVSGVLDASAPAADQGGDIRVLGNNVTLSDGAGIDVSGQQTGGKVLIGGDLQGKNNGVLNATTTTVEQGATIKADGAEQGGQVIVWSDGTTHYAGDISAHGKGFAEVSGKEMLRFSGSVDTGGGTLLLDPTNITVQSTAGDGVNTFSGAQIATLLGSNNVVLNADNVIAWNSGAMLDYNGVGARSLTLQAGTNITYSGTITDSVAGGDKLNVIFNADADGNGSGSIAINNGSIQTAGGDIVLRGGSGALTPLPSFNDAGYEAALRASAARNVTVNGSTLNAAGGNITIRGAGIDGGTSVGVGLSSSTVQTSGAGTIAMDGIGGNGAAGSNRGVQLISSAISTVDGLLTLQGTGAGTGVENTGVRVNTGTTVRATGSGNLVVNAVGGTGTNYNDGIVLDLSSTMSVADGNMTVTGTGRGTGSGSDGIELANTSRIEATGTGSVTLNGTSTATGADTNRGVVVWIGSNARTTSGTLTLQGASSDPAKGSAISLESVTIGGASQTGAISLQSAGSVLVSGSTIDTSGALGITGGTYTTAGASILKSNTLSFGNTNAISGSGTLTFNQTVNTTLPNVISGTVNVAKVGGNALTLTGNNTYSGTTAVNAGTLQVGNGATSGTLGTGAVTIASGANLVFDRSDTVTVANAIGGAGNLTQAGTGTTILTANNTLSGTTAVNAGTLQVGNGGTTGTLGTSAVMVDTGTTLRYFRSNTVGVANNISGTGTLEFLGTGLSANSDYVLHGNSSGFNGSVVIDRARVQYDNANDIGAGATINVLSGGQLLASANISNDMNLNGTGWLHPVGTLGALRLISGADASGDITLQSDSHISAYGSTGTVSGVISGAGKALDIQRGTLTLAGANTFTGPLTVQNGTVLILAPTASLATTAITLGNKSTGGGGGDAMLQHQADNQLNPNTVLTFDSLGNDRGYWQLFGTNQSVAGFVDSSVYSVIENAETQNGFGNGTITLTGSGNYFYGGYIRDKVSGTSGTLSLVKSGTGTQTIAGGNVYYTGPTAVNDGTLVLTNTPNFRSATTVGTGATLELAGNINMDHAAGFTLALNDGSTLRKTNTGYNTFNSSNVTVNGTVDIEINNSGVNNQLFIGGATTGLQGSGIINLTNTGSATTGLTLRIGPGSFSGDINVEGGAVNIGSGGSLALQNTDLNLTNSARFNLAGAYAGGATPASVKSLSGTSDTTVTLGGQTLTVGTNDGTGGDFAGVISGTGQLAKTGTGMQTLSGNNTYSGITTISGGVLQIGNGGTAGTLGTGNVTDNGSLVFNRSDSYTVPNLISGTGSITQAGSGTTILTGNNTYSGTTTISSGTLQVGANGTTGRLGTGAVTNNANLVFNRSDSTSLATLSAGGIMGTGNVTALIGGSLDVNRNIALTGANSTILLEAGKNQPAGTTTGGDVTLTNNISTSATGTITIFSGNATTAAYEAKVSGATGATRYKTYNADATDTSSAVTGTRNYFYRQSPTALSVSGLLANKVYDGLRDASVNTSVAVVNGLIDGDTLAPGSLNVGSAYFDSAHAGARTLSASLSSATGPSYSGSGATWSVSGYSTGSMAGSGTGSITPRSVTASINAVGKIYDGLTSTSSTLSAPTGFAGNDSASGVSGLQLAFDNPNAGMRNVVANGTGTLTGFSGAVRGDGSGIGVGNEVAGLASDYAFVAPAPAAATITPAALTVVANNDAKIVTQTDTPGYNGVSFSGFVNGESATNLGGTLTITRTNGGVEAAGDYNGVLMPSGYTSGNYTITYQAGNYKIVPAQQLLVRIQNMNNVYGTTLPYDVISAQYLDANGGTIKTLAGTRNGNTFTFTDGADGSVTFTVTPQGALTSGAGYLAAGNYSLAGSNVTVTTPNFAALNYVGNQTVDRAALTPQANGTIKVYDGTTDMPALSLDFSGLLLDDVVNATGTGAFASRNAGNNLSYYVDGIAISGADAANYYLTAGSLTGNNGVITPRQLTVTAVPATKVYDGTRSAPGTPTVTGSLGAGDSFTLLAQQFATPNVGTNLRLSPLVDIADGNGGGNYALILVDNNLGTIIGPAEDAPTLSVDISRLGGTNAAATLNNDSPDSRNDDNTVRCSDGNHQENCGGDGYGDAVYRIVSSGLKLPQGLTMPVQVDGGLQQ
ncbi:MAG TPA: autotransporter-associated beta strand repeat-containing protein [Methylophilaceae bacterium]|nr:autotransporter-associated beta strand repeat-containing protein [Methylophilaceae bacterium]